MRYASDQKVVDSQFDTRTGNASLCSSERRLKLIHCGPLAFKSISSPMVRDIWFKILKRFIFILLLYFSFSKDLKSIEVLAFTDRFR